MRVEVNSEPKLLSRRGTDLTAIAIFENYAVRAPHMYAITEMYALRKRMQNATHERRPAT